MVLNWWSLDPPRGSVETFIRGGGGRGGGLLTRNQVVLNVTVKCLTTDVKPDMEAIVRDEMKHDFSHLVYLVGGLAGDGWDVCSE